MPGIVVDIDGRRPALQVELVLGPECRTGSEKLKQGAIDAALMASPDAEPEIESIPLFEDDIFFAAARQLAIRRTSKRSICATAATKLSSRSARASRRITAFRKRFASRSSRPT